MDDVRPQIVSLLDGLYSAEVIDDVACIGAHYLSGRQAQPTYVDMPKDLHGFTQVRKMSDTKVPAPIDYESQALTDLGILTQDGQIKGAFNHIITRMITMPLILGGYVKNWPTEVEQEIFTDPPLLQRDRSYVTKAHDRYFAQAADKLASTEELAKRFAMLGELGEFAMNIEPVYPAKGSTEAYENFGIWHLLPGNKQVDLTATSPGVILPTEAKPLEYKDTVTLLKKNLMRSAYFDMLRLCVSSAFGDGRMRRYFADKKGTIDNLKKYPQFVEEAKNILAEYLKLGPGVFPIRIGDNIPEMKYATLVGDKGVVYSIRDKDQKNKIAHNLTVFDSNEGTRWRDAFRAQWEDAIPLDDVGIIDELMKQ